MKKIIKAWIIEDGRWASNQMLIYQTRKAAERRVYQGGMAEVWKVYSCEIKINQNEKIPNHRNNMAG